MNYKEFIIGLMVLLLGFDANGDGRPQSDRPAAAGRNTGRGEAFYNLDVRLARRIHLTESKHLEFTFEAFNVLNRTNFSGINNLVGTAPLATIDARGIKGRAPTEPLGSPRRPRRASRSLGRGLTSKGRRTDFRLSSRLSTKLLSRRE